MSIAHYHTLYTPVHIVVQVSLYFTCIELPESGDYVIVISTFPNYADTSSDTVSVRADSCE